MSNKIKIKIPSLCIFILIGIFSPAAHSASKSYGDVVVSRVTTIYDGDTFTVTINDWPAIIGKSISVRVYGIDTPEMRGKCEAEVNLARKVKQHTVAMLREAKKIELRSIQRDKYFRILAQVYVDGSSLADELIDSGYAVPYYGKTKKDWCK